MAEFDRDKWSQLGNYYLLQQMFGGGDSKKKDEEPAEEKQPDDGNPIWPSPMAGYPDWMPPYEPQEEQPPIGFTEMPEASSDNTGFDWEAFLKKYFGGGTAGGGSNYVPEKYKDPESIKELRAQIEAYKNRPKEIDLSPLAALTDAWSGSNFSRVVDKPESEQERQARVMAMQDRLAGKESAAQQKHAYTQYLMQKQADDRARSEQREEIKQYLKAQQEAKKQQEQQAKEQYQLGLKAEKNLKNNELALDTFTTQIFPEVVEDPTIHQITKVKINGALTQAGQDAEKAGLAAPGTGYFKVMNDVLSDQDKFNRFKAVVAQ